MMKCSKKAFAMCPTRHLCGTLDDATFTEESECAAFNNAVEDKPITNADCIRDMTDEELCKFLGEYKFCDICEEGCYSCTYNGDCDKRLLEWLQQPAEPPKEG